MKSVIRLANDVKDKMDRVAPPRKHMRSQFIRDALVNFLSKPKQPLADRPHIRGRGQAYKSICVILDPDLKEAIRKAYPEVSESVVIQAAISSELRKARYKIVGLSNGNEPDITTTTNAKDQDTDDYPSARGPARELAASFD